jgi:Tfp pilus assembly protein PilN
VRSAEGIESVNIRRALERRHTLILIALFTVITLAVTFATIEFLYDTAVTQERARLLDTVQSQARLIEAIAADELSESGDPVAARADTLAQVSAFH